MSHWRPSRRCAEPLPHPLAQRFVVQTADDVSSPAHRLLSQSDGQGDSRFPSGLTPVAWVSLDEGDNDLGRLMPHILVAGATGFCHSTVWKVLRRAGLSRPPKAVRELANRYEWPCPGDLLHMDTKNYYRLNATAEVLPAAEGVPYALGPSHTHRAVRPFSRLPSRSRKGAPCRRCGTFSSAGASFVPKRRMRSAPICRSRRICGSNAPAAAS